MSISFISMNRLVEQRAAEDEVYRKQLERSQKRTLSDGRALSDEALLEKLRSLGLHIDRDWLDRSSRSAPSAEALFQTVMRQSQVKIPVTQEDWVWIVLVCLWERWFPDRLNLEMIDDLIQAGYRFQREYDSVEASHRWLKAWAGVEHLMQAFQIPTIEKFDGCFGGTQCLFNWLQDLSCELECAGETDRSFVVHRVKFCESVLAYAETSDDYRWLISAFENNLAESQAELVTEVAAPRPRSDDNSNDKNDHGEYGLDEIIAEIDVEYLGSLPEFAIRAAQRRPREITPRLIDLLRNATQLARAGDCPSSVGSLIAILLLTEFRAPEALPVILEAVSLPNDGVVDLLGDIIPEQLSSVFAAMAPDATELIDDLIANSDRYEQVRLAAAKTYLLWVRDGRMTREQAVRRLGAHLSQAITDRDIQAMRGLVVALRAYASDEVREEIEQAYRQGLVDEWNVSPEDIGQDIAEGEACFQDAIDSCAATGVDDTVDAMRCWFLNEVDWSGEMLTDGDDLDDEEWTNTPEHNAPPTPLASSTTIRSTTPRVGRNERCPCGSGKKFKKCCGAR